MIGKVLLSKADKGRILFLNLRKKKYRYIFSKEYLQLIGNFIHDTYFLS